MVPAAASPSFLFLFSLSLGPLLICACVLCIFGFGADALYILWSCGFRDVKTQSVIITRWCSRLFFASGTNLASAFEAAAGNLPVFLHKRGNAVRSDSCIVANVRSIPTRYFFHGGVGALGCLCLCAMPTRAVRTLSVSRVMLSN